MTLQISPSNHVYQPNETRCHLPLSAYWRATSATASPILCLICGIFSVSKAWSNFCRITIFCADWRVRKSSLGSSLPGSFFDLVAMRRNTTAANDRVWKRPKKCQRLSTLRRDRFWITGNIRMLLQTLVCAQPNPWAKRQAALRANLRLVAPPRLSAVYYPTTKAHEATPRGRRALLK